MANEDRDYLDIVRRQHCCAPGCNVMPCEAHHPRNGVGGGLRGHDRTAIPLCTAHHRDLHGLSGPFKSWDGRSLRDWQQDRVEETKNRCLPLLDIHQEQTTTAAFEDDLELDF